MCGSPAVPRTSARPSDRKSIWLVVSDAVLQSRLEERVALAGVAGSGAQQVADVEVELRQHQHRDQDRARHQQDGLHDLHPGGALHAADDDVEDHQQAHGDDREPDRPLTLDAEQQRDQRAGAHHLRQQVEDRDHDRGGGRRGAHRALTHPVGELVGHRVAAGVAEQLRDQQQGDQPGDQEADGVEEAVVPGQRDGSRDAEERRGAHVVAGDRQTVLEAAEVAPARVVVRGGLGVAAGPERDPDR